MVMLRYLLDANVLSEPMRPDPNPAVLARIEAHRRISGTAAPVWHELWFGCERLPVSRRRQRLENYLLDVVQPTTEILPYDAAAAHWHSAERARLVSIGLTPPFSDSQIAAIAAINGLILVTANVADFRHFNGLLIENWHE